MIFFTVGTHEQPFDRAVEGLDRLMENQKPDASMRNEFSGSEAFIQTGYSNYKPRFCDFSEFLGFNEMIERMRSADIVITHGGTGSIMLVLYNKKVPIVIPRQKKYDEHIDDHQVHFCRTMEARGKIIPVYDISDLGKVIKNYSQMVDALQKDQPAGDSLTLTERAGAFSQKLTEICSQW